MPETNEIIEQATSRIPAITVPATAAAVVLPLAVYGAQDLTRKAARKVTTFVQDRKARKTNLTVVPDAPTA